MTELDIERERREFAAWYAPIFRGGEPENMPLRKNGEYVAPQDQIAWMAWLAAKRSMQGSAEPVSLQDAPEKIYLVIEDDNGNEPYRSFEYAQKEANMSYGIMWCTDPQGPNDIPYVRVDLAAPPAPVCAEPVRTSLLPMGEKNSEWYFSTDDFYVDVERDKDGKYSIFFRDRTKGSEGWLDQAEPPSADAKDSERLDFMLLGKRYVVGNIEGDRYHVREIDQFGDSKRIHTDLQQTPRAAIDAAIAAKEAK